MVPNFVARTGGSEWLSALPTGSKWLSALPTGSKCMQAQPARPDRHTHSMTRFTEE